VCIQQPTSRASAYSCVVAPPRFSSLRKRLPVVVCIVTLFVCVTAIGAVCAVCVSAHPGPSIERTLGSVPVATLPPEAGWSLVLVLAFAPLVLVRPRRVLLGRTSPAELQRFLL
jgi:hypothetical protein